ncbi:MAG: MATE family efflux transporter [Blautia sp.]
MKIKMKQQVDFLHGNIFRGLLVFAFPILLSNLFQQMYNTVDTMLVGHVLGETSLAAVGASVPVYELLVGFAMGIGNGLSIVTARSYGVGDLKLLKRTVACALLIGAGIALVLTVAARIGVYPLLQLLNTPEEIIQEANSYISVVTVFLGVMLAYNLCSGLLRAIGNSVMPLVFLVLSSIGNMILDYLFMAKMNMGIRGAAVATVLAQGISVVLCVIYVVKKFRMLVPEKGDFRVEKALFGEMFAQGMSMALMNSVVSAGSVILQSGINSLGYLTIAGHTTARKIYQFCNMPITAMANAVSTFVSQNRGADQPERIRKSVFLAFLYNLVITMIIVVFLNLTAPMLVALVSGSSDSIVMENGTRYLRVVAPFYVVLGVLFDVRMSLQGIGQKLLPLVSSVIELLGKILFVTAFIPRLGYNAVIFCEPSIWCVMTAYLLFVFLRDPYIRNRQETEQKI